MLGIPFFRLRYIKRYFNLFRRSHRHVLNRKSIPFQLYFFSICIFQFRRGNVNYIRTSHYPPDEALLEACDELGMLVEVEAPFCWAHNTNVPEEMHDAVLVNQHVEMVNLNRSHPSVIMWSFTERPRNGMTS